MTEISIDAGRIAELAARFEQGPALLEREFGKAMQLSVLAVEGSAKEAAPVDTGNLRRSITSTATPFEGRVGTNLPYGPVMEHGRSPGAAMPPAGSLLGWMGRKGIPAELEYVIRRAIARNGIAGKRYMEQALQRNEGRIREYFEAAGQAVARQIAGGR